MEPSKDVGAGDQIKDDRLQAERPTTTGTCEGGNSAGSSKNTAGGNNLDDLFSTLRQQISTSDWLDKNTAEKWEADNPQLAKDYKEAAKKS